MGRRLKTKIPQANDCVTKIKATNDRLKRTVNPNIKKKKIV